MITVDHPSFLAALGDAERAARHDGAAGFHPLAVSWRAGISRDNATQLVAAAELAGLLVPVATPHVTWQLTDHGRQALAAAELAAARRPVRRRARSTRTSR